MNCISWIVGSQIESWRGHTIQSLGDAKAKISACALACNSRNLEELQSLIATPISQPWRLDPTRRPTRSLVVHSSQLVCTYTPTTEHELVSAYVYGNSNFDRSDSELKIVGEYGLRNKREVWRVQLTLSKIRRAAR